VVGIDIAADMVRRTSAEVKRTGPQNVELFEMDAEALDFPDAAFDYVLCGLSIFFFPNLSQALSKFHRVLKAGGRLGVTTFSENNEFSDWMRRIVKSYLPPPDSQDQEEEEKKKLPPHLDTPLRLEETLSRAGFEAIQVKAEEADFVYADEEEWWSSLWSHGLRDAMESIEPATRARLKADAFQEIQVFKQPDGIHAGYGVLFAFGTKTGLDASIASLATQRQ
jgi:SAM-dependent methyltransferase